MAEPRRRSGLPPELGVASLVVAASFPLGRLFRTSEVGTVAFSAAVVSAAVAWGMRRLRAPALLSALGSAAAFLWFASVAFFRGELLGPLPGPGSLGLIWDAMVEGVRRSQSDAAPVPASVSFLVLVAFAVWATTWLADDAAVKLRHPMLAVGVTVPLFVLPGTILEGDRRWVDAGFFLAAALWVLFQDERFRLSRWGRVVGTGAPGWRPGLAVRIGTVTIFLALAATPILPGFGAPPGLQGINAGGGRIAINPLVSVRPQLADKSLTEVFRVRTSVPTYWRLTALDRFDGLVWSSGAQRPTLQIGNRTIPPQNPADGTRVRQQIEIRNLAGPWLPVAWEPVRVEGLRGIGADPASRTVIVGGDLRYGTRYEVVSRLPRLTFEALDAAPPATDLALRPYLQLPARAEIPRVAAIARRVAGDASSPFRQAVALQSYLRTFRYNEDVALTHDIDDLEEFLVEDREGYCEQFAAAMAVMARTLGLPSRVAIGFAVGEQGNTPEDFVVTSRQAHAWVEIYVAGFGWIPFEPTPRADSVVVPGYTSPAQVSPEPTSTANPEPTPTASASPTATPRSERFEEPLDQEPGAGAPNRWIPVAIGVAALVVASALALPFAARLRRTLRFRRARTAAERVSARYLDFLDWCAASRIGRRPGETPFEHAVRLAEASSEADTPLAELARLATDAVYAPADGFDPAGAAALAAQARTALAGGFGRRARLLARIGWGWWRVDPAVGRGASLTAARTGAATFAERS